MQVIEEKLPPPFDPAKPIPGPVLNEHLMRDCWHLLVPYTTSAAHDKSGGRVLHLESGELRWFAHFVTLDSGEDYKGLRAADHKLHPAKPLPFADGAWDAIVATHAVELCPDLPEALAEWWRCLAPGGHLVFVRPDRDPGPDRVRAPVDMTPLMLGLEGGWTQVEDEARHAQPTKILPGGGPDYRFQVFRKAAPDSVEKILDPWRKPAKSALVVRLGAAGDQIVASSILPLLKREGWTVTYNVTSEGREIVREDPHVDRWLIQETNQVNNLDLGPYYARLQKERYERYIDLSESVEGAVLTLPDRPQYHYAHEVRRNIFGKINYLERTHDIAGLAHEFAPRFYPTAEETERCRRFLAKLDGPTVLWIMRGSAPHKFYPWVAQTVVRLLYGGPGTIILAGDASCAPLEEHVVLNATQNFGPQAQDRIVRTSGGWPIRATMALAQLVDCVVGPETGVLNAVCVEDVPKVVFLSHSTRENLTKHWRNTTVLETSSEHLACAACVRMIYDWKHCNQDPNSGAAMCQAMISPDRAAQAIRAALAPRAQVPGAYVVRDGAINAELLAALSAAPPGQIIHLPTGADALTVTPAEAAE